jgi:coenzyme F420-dependent glucose-6-phosphate dehydrogenase
MSAVDAARSAPTIGYWLSSEEHGASTLVTNAVRAERAGFPSAMISDHFHPWVRRQGQSPFVWTVLGAIANATDRLRVGTGVSAAVSRFSPVVLAQAAATTAALYEGRFFLGMGTGERLNEHITGARWPSTGERREMLEEAIGVIRDLWSGKEVNHRGDHFTVEHAQLFTLPATPPDLLIAAGGKRTAALAGRLADGVISVAPDEQLVEVFEESGGHGKRRIGQVKVCYAASEDDAKATALEWWPNGVLQGGPNTELPRPRDFEAATATATAEAIGDVIVCGPDPARHLAAIRAFLAAGYDEVYVHQVGPDQASFLDFYRLEILPELVDAADASR